MSEDVLYLNALNHLINIRSFYFAKILANFPAKEIWQDTYSDLLKKGISPKTAQQICQKKQINPEREWEKLSQQQIIALIPDDVEFPRLLKEITPLPPLLYIKGNADLLNRKAIAVVGTRKATNYGLQAAKDLASGLSSAGLIIVSGLAFGIDSQAHQSTLENNDQTIAVLGSGLDRISPVSNYHLAEQILKKDGAIVSEYPLGYPASKFTFPERNHIISGLSLGVIVVEAGLKSGAQITARAALEQNREVFCVPGSIYSENSAGCHKFIAQGAHLVTNPDDVLEVLNIKQRHIFAPNREQKNLFSPATAEEKIILENLSSDPVSVDFLAEKTGLPIEKTTALMNQMEINDLIKDAGGGGYVVN